MKLVKPFLAAALLLALAPLAAAENIAADLEPAAAAVAPEPVETIQLDDLFAAGEECAAAAAPAQAALDVPQPVPLATGTCGACSDSPCQGVPRGTSCGSGRHCNIFSGGFRCPTGGWDCQCRSGDLP